MKFTNKIMRSLRISLKIIAIMAFTSVMMPVTYTFAQEGEQLEAQEAQQDITIQDNTQDQALAEDQNAEALVDSAGQDTTDEADNNENNENNENITFTIYVDENCPHCKVVEEFVADNDLQDSIIYRQISESEEIFDELLALWEELKVTEEEKGWPFLVYEKDGEKLYEVGDSPIVDFLAQEFEIDIEESQSNNSQNSGSNALMLIGGVFFFAIIGYVIYSMVVDKKD